MLVAGDTSSSISGWRRKSLCSYGSDDNNVRSFGRVDSAQCFRRRRLLRWSKHGYQRRFTRGLRALIISTLLRAAVRPAGGLLGVATARTETALRLKAPRASECGRMATPVAKADCILLEYALNELREVLTRTLDLNKFEATSAGNTDATARLAGRRRCDEAGLGPARRRLRCASCVRPCVVSCTVVCVRPRASTPRRPCGLVRRRASGKASHTQSLSTDSRCSSQTQRWGLSCAEPACPVPRPPVR